MILDLWHTGEEWLTLGDICLKFNIKADLKWGTPYSELVYVLSNYFKCGIVERKKIDRLVRGKGGSEWHRLVWAYKVKPQYLCVCNGVFEKNLSRLKEATKK